MFFFSRKMHIEQVHQATANVVQEHLNHENAHLRNKIRENIVQKML